MRELGRRVGRDSGDAQSAPAVHGLGVALGDHPRDGIVPGEVCATRTCPRLSASAQARSQSSPGARIHGVSTTMRRRGR